jgi:hypothetical protein
MRRLKDRAGVVGEQGRRRLVGLQRAAGEQECGALGKLVNSVRRALSSGIARTSSAFCAPETPRAGATRSASRASSASRI